MTCTTIHSGKRVVAATLLFSAFSVLPSLLGCNSIRNGWLDPTVLGNFERTITQEIRTSLTLEETPRGIAGSTPPTNEDRRLIIEEYPISAGDTLAIEINELRNRQEVYQSQAIVSSTGYVNLPVVGRVDAVDKTVPEFEAALVAALEEGQVLLSPDVTVNPIFQNRATYSIFGIGASASNNAPLRAGTFPIRRPDLRLLEAINQVGGLNEFVTEVYVFRWDRPPTPGSTSPLSQAPIPPANDTRQHHDSLAQPTSASDSGDPVQQELFDAVIDPPGINAGAQSGHADQGAVDRPSDILQAMDDDPVPPLLWVNGEFVPNPAFQGESALSHPGPASAPSFDTALPSINWSRIAGDNAYRILEISADRLRGGDPDVNIYIRAGDVIRIVSGEIGEYYVMGQVNQGGSFRFNAEKITLKAAIAIAGGLSPLAWPDRCTIYRRLGQREQMIQVNLDRIFGGQDPDFLIRRGDIINVGTHPFAPFLARIRALSLPNPVSNVGYSFTYARNFADIDSYAAKQNPSNEPDRFQQLFP